MYSLSSNSKTQALRQTIRSQYIESYKKKIRKRFEQNQIHSSKKIKNICNQNDDNIMHQQITDPAAKTHAQSYYLYTLTEMLNYSHQQLCTIQNFQILLESVYHSNSKNSSQQNQYHFSSSNSMVPNILSRWAFKQKTNSLVYRIVDKVLASSEYQSYQQPFNRIRTVSEKMLCLLDFPEIMPLWQKVSQINDIKLKEFFAQKFTQIIIKENKHHIFDPEFVLDVIYNFIVKPPQIGFNYSIELLRYVSYEINNRQPKNYSWANRICMLLRSILKQNGRIIIVQMIQYGYEHLFLTLIGMLNKQQNRYKDSKIKLGYECFEHDKSQLFSSAVIFKISLVKLINRIFILNPEVSCYIYSKSFNFLLPSLLHELRFAECQQKSKYQYILCKSHQILCRNILIAVATILMAKKDNVRFHQNVNPIKDFCQNNGIIAIRKIIDLKNSSSNFNKQIVNIISALEVQELFWNINQEAFHQIMDLLVEFIIQNFVEKIHLKQYTDFQQEINLHKTLKMMKSLLLGAYSRATLPNLFQELSNKILFNKDIYDFLKYICCREHIEAEGYPIQRANLSQQQSYSVECKKFSKQILNICEKVKEFLENSSHDLKLYK